MDGETTDHGATDGETIGRRRVLHLGGLVAGAAVGVTAVGAPQASAAGGTARAYRRVRMDARSAGEALPRALFSITGYAQLTVDGNAHAHETYAKLRPAGTQARIEVVMEQAAPEPGAFHPEQMFRFVDNTGDAYWNEVTGLGMEPVLLCAYNTHWLSATGQANTPPTDPQGWADIVARIVEHFNGRGSEPGYHRRLRYVEVWNEPNLTQFWTGSEEEYFELFRVTAATIHENFPGVQVGGPVFSPGIEGYYDYGRRFVDAVGSGLDYFVYHSYGDDPDKIVADIALWSDYLDTHAGRPGIPLMVTESEQFKDSDAVKVQNLIGRQFALLEHGDRMLGWHQFCLSEYKEGWYTFGLVHPDGAVFDRNYWPYWLFRDAEGQRVRVASDTGNGGDADGEHAVGSRTSDGRRCNLVYWRDPAAASGPRDVRLMMDLPRSTTARVLTVSTVAGTGGQVVAAHRIGAGARSTAHLARLLPGTAVSLTVHDGDAEPWVGLTANASEVAVGEVLEVTATVVNTTLRTMDGTLTPAGFPAGWTVTPVSGRPGFRGLSTGEAGRVAWQVRVGSATAGPVAFWASATLSDGSGSTSIPLRVTAT